MAQSPGHLFAFSNLESLSELDSLTLSESFTDSDILCVDVNMLALITSLADVDVLVESLTI